MANDDNSSQKEEKVNNERTVSETPKLFDEPGIKQEIQRSDDELISEEEKSIE